MSCYRLCGRKISRSTPLSRGTCLWIQLTSPSAVCVWQGSAAFSPEIWWESYTLHYVQTRCTTYLISLPFLPPAGGSWKNWNCSKGKPKGSSFLRESCRRTPCWCKVRIFSSTYLPPSFYVLDSQHHFISTWQSVLYPAIYCLTLKSCIFQERDFHVDVFLLGPEAPYRDSVNVINDWLPKLSGGCLLGAFRICHETLLVSCNLVSLFWQWFF